MTTTDRPPYRDGKLHVLADKCSTCVFRPGNKMSLPPGRLADLVAQNVAAGAALVCHQTLPYGDHPNVGEGLCRGFWDGPAADTPYRQLADRLDVTTYVNPPTKEDRP